MPFRGVRRAIFTLGASIWTSSTTPQSLVRGAGEWVGKGVLVDGYVKRRFQEDIDIDEFSKQDHPNRKKVSLRAYASLTVHV